MPDLTPVGKGILKFAAVEAGVLILTLGVLFGLSRHGAARVSPNTSPDATPVAAEATADMAPAPINDHDKPSIISSPDAAEVAEKPQEAATPYPAIDPKRLLAKNLKVVDHEVELGENYWTVAKDFNIDVPTVFGANPDMDFVAHIHQHLLVPNRKGALHAVAKGETLKSIADAYKAKVEDLKKENSISWWHGIREGDVLFVADVKPVRMNDKWRAYFGSRGFFGMPFASWGRGWSSKFGKRVDPITGLQGRHPGVDFRAKFGVDVFASATGRVIFAGVAGGYGNLVQIRHNKEYISYYGHLSKILVKQGQHVHRGQIVGKVGATGRVTGPHLHFEIRRYGKPIDPLPLM